MDLESFKKYKQNLYENAKQAETSNQAETSINIKMPFKFKTTNDIIKNTVESGVGAKPYNFTLDTTQRTPEEKANVAHNEYLNNNPYEKVKEAVAAGALGALDKASMGLYPTLLKKLEDIGVNPKGTYRSIQGIQERNPNATGVGELSGYLVPGTLATKALKATSIGAKLLPKAGDSIASFIGKGALTGAIENTGIGAVEGGFESLRDNKPFLPTVANSAINGALSGAVLGGVGGAIAKPAINYNAFKTGLKNVQQSIDNYNFPQLREPNVLPLPETMAKSPRISPDIPVQYRQPLPKVEEPLMLNPPSPYYVSPQFRKEIIGDTSKNVIPLKNNPESGLMASKVKGSVILPETNLNALERNVVKDNSSMINKIGDFYDRSLSDKNLKEKMLLGQITQDHATLIRDKTGLNVDDFIRQIDSDAVRHIIKKHGSEKELLRGQSPVTRQDIMYLIDNLNNIHEVTPSIGKGGKNVLELKIGKNGEYTYIETVGEKNKRLTTKTMWKKNLSPAANELPLANIRNEEIVNSSTKNSIPQISNDMSKSHINKMNPDDFDSINTIDDLPDDINELTSYINEAQRRIDQNKNEISPILPKINLQLFAEAQKKLTRYQKNMQRFDDIESLTSNSDNWKDKGAFSFSRETQDRNLIDVAGKDEGAKLKEAIIDPIHSNEAESTRMKNYYRNEIKKLDLSPKESELVQKFGEGKITIDDLKTENIDANKIQDAVKTFRNIYNELFQKANKALMRNGYDPVPYRKDYFPHFEENNNLLKQFGIDLKSNELPTDISGLTADFRPGKNWFGNFLQRKTDQTTFDALQGFDRYVEGISKVIHHTDDIQKLRTFIQTLRNKYSGTPKLTKFVANLEEYTNNLAGKKSMGDRGFEATFGRKFYTVMDAVKRRVSSNMVGVNLNSWLTNTIPLINAAAENNKISVAKALNDTVKNMLKDDGFINKSTFLTNRVGSDPLFLTGIQKAIDKATAPFKMIDNFTSQIVTRSKYYDALSKGLSEKEALRIADDWANKTIGGRSLGSTPNLFNQRNPLVSLFTQFQLEVNNQLSHVFKDLPDEYSKGRLSSVGAQLLLYGYLYNQLFSKVTGNKPALDPIGMIQDIYNTATNKKIPGQQKAKNITKTVTNPVPFTGALGLMGASTGGRLPISAAIPDLTNISSLKSAKKELSKPLYYILPPVGGGQLKKTIEGVKAVSEGGEYTEVNGKKKKLYNIQKTPYNFMKAASLGKSSLEETKDYYEKGKKK